MADVRNPTPPDYEYGRFKNLPATAGPAGVADTFFGPRSKTYVDFLARQIVRLRGVNAYYYVLEDQNRRIDGDAPLTNAVAGGRVDKPKPAIPDPFQRVAHAGSALYGERIVLRQRLDSVRREVEVDWPYLDPILVRGLPSEFEHEQDPDENGSIYVKRLTFELARVHCDREWGFQPRPGDIVRLPKLANAYMDVEDVTRDESRWGNTGFFSVYRLTLVKSSRYEPQRKLAPDKLTDPPPPGGDPNPGALS